MDRLDSEWFVYYDDGKEAETKKDDIRQLVWGDGISTKLEFDKETRPPRWIITVRANGWTDEKTFDLMTKTIRETYGEEHYSGWYCRIKSGDKLTGLIGKD